MEAHGNVILRPVSRQLRILLRLIGVDHPDIPAVLIKPACKRTAFPGWSRPVTALFSRFYIEHRLIVITLRKRSSRRVEAHPVSRCPDSLYAVILIESGLAGHFRAIIRHPAGQSIAISLYFRQAVRFPLPHDKAAVCLT